MIKILFCLRRLPRLTPAAFQLYWREQHAPLVHRHAALLGIRRYVQSHSIADSRLAGLAVARGTAVAAYDGVAELWFDSLAFLTADPASLPEASRLAARALLDDERRFIDLPASPIFVVEEQEIIDYIPRTGGEVVPKRRDR